MEVDDGVRETAAPFSGLRMIQALLIVEVC